MRTFTFFLKSYRGLLSLALAILISNLSNAQDILRINKIPTFCKTVSKSPPKIFAKELSVMKSSSTGTLYNECTKFNINVFYHIVRNTDGSNGQPTSVINQMHSMLNNDYSNYQISFNNVGNDFINDNSHSTGWDNDTASVINNKVAALALVNVNSTAINVYILPDDQYNGGQAANIPSRAFVIGGKIQGFNIAASKVASHEMGHCLGLYHTFHSPCDDQNVSVYENPNGSN